MRNNQNFKTFKRLYTTGDASCKICSEKEVRKLHLLFAWVLDERSFKNLRDYLSLWRFFQMPAYRFIASFRNEAGMPHTVGFYLTRKSAKPYLHRFSHWTGSHSLNTSKPQHWGLSPTKQSPYKVSYPNTNTWKFYSYGHVWCRREPCSRPASLDFVHLVVNPWHFPSRAEVCGHAPQLVVIISSLRKFRILL